ncbi:KAP family P-loop NTPase fold protein [Microtetraspora glauca]|uniref:P-loop NTPase fold protein n=1 Tax=Microtetraspora glauca TaxID=1996 RepID=A0ABV3GAT5_MICGL
MSHGTVDVPAPGTYPADEPTDGRVRARKALVFLDPEDPGAPAGDPSGGLPARRLVGALATNGYAVESVPGGGSLDHHHFGRFLDAAEPGDLLVVRWPTGRGWSSRDFAALISGFARRAGDCAADALVMIVDFGWVVDTGDADSDGSGRSVSRLPVRGEPSIVAAALTTGLAVGERPPARGFSLTGLIADGFLTGAADVDGDGVITIADLHRYAVTACAGTGLRPRLIMYGDAPAVSLARTGRAASGTLPGELLPAAGELVRRGETAVPSTAYEIVTRIYDVYLGSSAQRLLRLASLLEDDEPLTPELADLLLTDGEGAGARALAELGTPWELTDRAGSPAHPSVRDAGRERLTREEHNRASTALRRWRADRRAVQPRARLTPDRWTTDDQLGHRIYAEAIAAFVRHPETSPPLTIGIKGPWGTGKTSLMRMIQELLDPGAADGRPAEIHLARPVPQGRARKRSLLSRLRPPRGRGGGQGAEPPGVTNAEVLSRARRRAAERSREDADLSAPERLALRASDWRPTVWFNPWMYQNGEQVWAGLAHEIISQVTGRLPRGERERFWLELNLGRIDREAVRRRAYRMAITRLTPVALGLAATLVLTGASLGAAALVPALGPALRAAAAALGTCGSVGVFVAGALRLARFLTESADTAFGRLIQPPDLLGPAPGLARDLVTDPGYGAKTGFLHLVQADMRRVLRLVATEERPLVVFVDDLDRCGSGTVAQVIEAINLFLAGEFPDCVFVLAMEPEVVVAHVEVAYQVLVEAMPGELRSGLGWRFLEKIVQLPLSLPMLEDAHRLPGYVSALLGVDRSGGRPPVGRPRTPGSGGMDATDTGAFPGRSAEDGHRAPRPREAGTGSARALRTNPSRPAWAGTAGDRTGDARFWGWTAPRDGEGAGSPRGGREARSPRAHAQGAGPHDSDAPGPPGSRTPDLRLVELLESAIRAAGPTGDTLDTAARDAQQAVAAGEGRPDGGTGLDLWPETRLAADRVYDDLYTDENAYRAIEAALPALSATNPRQLKRYVNVFRFYSFVTYRQGLAGADRADDAAVAKVAALAVRWPHLLSALARECGSGETVLDVLERAASTGRARAWEAALARCGLAPYGRAATRTRMNDGDAPETGEEPREETREETGEETHEGAPEWDALRELLASRPSVAGLARRLL